MVSVMMSGTVSLSLDGTSSEQDVTFVFRATWPGAHTAKKRKRGQRRFPIER